MSANIKYIVSFSEVTIDTALHWTVTGDDQETFEATLKSVADKLEKPASTSVLTKLKIDRPHWRELLRPQNWLWLIVKHKRSLWHKAHPKVIPVQRTSGKFYRPASITRVLHSSGPRFACPRKVWITSADSGNEPLCHCDPGFPSA